MKENECNVFEEKAKQNSEMELKRINEININNIEIYVMVSQNMFVPQLLYNLLVI